MAQTITQKDALNTVRMTTGRILDTGTVASSWPMTITLGYKPRKVTVWNNTSGDMYEWIEGMADASAQKTVAAGTRSLITTLGITPSATGFIMGFDLDLIVTSEQLTWVALG